MSQRGITDLGPAPRAYRVDLLEADGGQSAFETLRDSRQEDLRRAGCLRRASRRHPNELAVAHAERLAQRLEDGAHQRTPDPTLASSVWMRSTRIRLTAAIWVLYLLTGGTTFTLIPRGWEFTPAQLTSLNPAALLSTLRGALIRAGYSADVGWLFVCIHGEFDPVAGVFRIHVHGMCSWSVVPVVDRLRTQRRFVFNPWLTDGSPDPVYRRVWVRRKPLYELPKPITYLLQSFWPSRPIYLDHQGRRRRVRTKQAISEPIHSQVLLWLDRWDLTDLTLIMGLRVTTKGLVQTHR